MSKIEDTTVLVFSYKEAEGNAFHFLGAILIVKLKEEFQIVTYTRFQFLHPLQLREM